MTNSNTSWLTQSSTEPEDWGKWRQRVARESLVVAFPNGPPVGLTFKRMVDVARGVCAQQGLPLPSDRTYQRVINGT